MNKTVIFLCLLLSACSSCREGAEEPPGQLEIRAEDHREPEASGDHQDPGDREDPREVESGCLPDCGGNVCGSDGCGGECGDCPAGEACVDHVCQCTPDCANRECGFDGCGGVCDLCPEGRICDESSGRCVEPEPFCEDGWCRIPAGSFLMGYTMSISDGITIPDPNTPPKTPVKLTRSFEIGATEVTRKRWMEVMDTTVDPSKFPECGPMCPATGMTYFSILDYANRLSLLAGYSACYTLNACDSPEVPHLLMCESATFLGPDCTGYRLPSEAEWEYASRAGVQTCYVTGPHEHMGDNCYPDETVSESGWFCGNSAVDYEGCSKCSEFGHPTAPPCCGMLPVGQKPMNKFGLHDVSGNAWELTGTVFDQFYSEPRPPLVDPGFTTHIDGAVVDRGGSYQSNSLACCLSFRGGTAIHDNQVVYVKLFGFRLVRTLIDDSTDQRG